MAFLDVGEWWRFHSESLRELQMRAMMAAAMAGKQTAERQVRMRLEWDLLLPEVEGWAMEFAGKLVSEVTDNIRAEIRQVVVEGLSGGLPWRALRGEIEKRTGLPTWRAERIARTEVIRAHAAGAVEGYKASGTVRGLRWLDGQAGVCRRCEALDDQMVALGQPFYEDTFGDGLPPRHPNRRCAVAPITLEQVKQLPEDHPLRDDRRNSIEELTDKNTFVEINGIRLTGERLRHARFGHRESTPEIAEYLIRRIREGGLQYPGKFKDVRHYVQDENGG